MKFTFINMGKVISIKAIMKEIFQRKLGQKRISEKLSLKI